MCYVEALGEEGPAPVRGLPEVEGRELIAEVLERVRGADGGRHHPHNLGNILWTMNLPNLTPSRASLTIQPTDADDAPPGRPAPGRPLAS